MNDVLSFHNLNLYVEPTSKIKKGIDFCETKFRRGSLKRFRCSHFDRGWIFFFWVECCGFTDVRFNKFERTQVILDNIMLDKNTSERNI